jgi:parallel beta-helix repeat protein
LFLGETIYIRADGSVDPPTAPIRKNGDLYSLTDNIVSSGWRGGAIVIEKDDITLDGAGYTLQGSYNHLLTLFEIGINVTERTNVTIKGMEIRKFGRGILLDNSSHNTLDDNTITENHDYGIELENSPNNTITANNIKYNNETGIMAWSGRSDANDLAGNNVTNNGRGISLTSFNCRLSSNTIEDNEGFGLSLGGGGNVLRNNTISGNSENFGDEFYQINDVDTSNTVNGRPIYYWTHKSDLSVPSDAGFVALFNCTRITVQNLTLSNNLVGIKLINTTDSTIARNTLAKNRYGLSFHRSPNNRIVENNISANSWEGMHLFNSQSNVIVGNNISFAGLDGIHLKYYSSYNSIVGNNISFNGYNGIGFYDSSSYNFIYHNNFVYNKYNEVLDYFWTDPQSPRSINVWDDGYPSGGNYWKRYELVDEKSGLNQNEFGSDGINDTGLVRGEGFVEDDYPLVGPFLTFDSGHYDGVTFNIDVVSNSTVEDFTYFESNSTVMLHVSNMTANQTRGFCRLAIPHELLSPPYTITVNGTQVSYTPIFENETLSIVYFSYEHSELEIVIIPEFPSFLILPVFMLTTLAAAVAWKRKRLKLS